MGHLSNCHLHLRAINTKLFGGMDSLIAQFLKSPPAMLETCVRSLALEDPLEKGKATHSSILAWRIPWTIAHGAAKI